MCGSSFIAQVKPGWNNPLNAVLIALCCTSLLLLINIGSTGAFNAVSFMGNKALLTTYIFSIGCLAVRHLRGPPLPYRRWSLGRAGVAVYLIAIGFLRWMWIFLFFPTENNPSLRLMNWDVLINGGVMILGFVYYALHGRGEYSGPVALVPSSVNS